MSDREVFSAQDDPLRYLTPSERAAIPPDGPYIYTQADRQTVIDEARSLTGPIGGIYRKRARIVAIRLEEPFRVATDRGLMQGAAGDWLVTNHPDDDPGSDVWSISDERMRATYEPVDTEDRL